MIEKRVKKAYRPKYGTHDDMALRLAARLERADLKLQPLARSRVVQVMMQGRSALGAIVSGQGSMGHAEFLAGVSNLAVRLCEKGLGTEEDNKSAKAGRDAILAMGQRRIDTGRWGLTGPELLAVRTLLELREAQLESEDNTNWLEIEAAMDVDNRIAAGNVIRVIEVVDAREAAAA